MRLGELAVDLLRGALSHPDRFGHEARHARDVPARIYAIGARRLALARSDERAFGVEGRSKRCEVGILADRDDDRVGLEPELAAGDRRHRELTSRRARGEGHLHAFQPQACAAGLDGLVQHRAVDEHHAFLERLGDFLALRRHLRRTFQREEGDRVARAPRAPRDVERGAASADDHEPTAERGRGAGIRPREIVGAINNPRARVIEPREALLAARSHGDIDGVEFAAQGLERFARLHRFAADLDPERHDAGDLAVEDRAREAIRGDAVAHHAAQLGPGFEHA